MAITRDAIRNVGNKNCMVKSTTLIQYENLIILCMIQRYNTINLYLLKK